MSGINKVILVGRLGTDPEFKALDGGSMVTKMSVATSETWTDKNGEKQERTEWHRVVVWGKLAEICSKFLSKGRQAFFEGKLQTRSWEDDTGQKKYATEIIASNVQFLGDTKTTQPVDNSTMGASDEFFDQEEPVPNFAPGQSHGPPLNETPSGF